MARRGPRLAGFVALIALALLPATSAQAAQIVTIDAPSKYVDPSHAPDNLYNKLPDGSKHPKVLRASVYLPDGYDPKGKQRYPLLLLLHGQGDSYAAWPAQKNGDLLNTAKGFPGIVVMPEGDRGFYANWYNGGKYGDPQWERYHLDELIPLIERSYRIAPGRASHAIAGLSMGGEGALYYASQRPGYFGSVAAFSAPASIERSTYQTGFSTFTGQDLVPIFGDPTAQEFYWAGHNPSKLVDNLRETHVFMAVGDGQPGPNDVANPGGAVAEAELAQQANEFASAARAAGVDLTFMPQQGIHDWPYWRRHLQEAIQWGLFRGVTENPTDWTFHTVSETGDAWGFRYEFSAPPKTVETLSRKGNRLSGDGGGVVSMCAANGGQFTDALPFDEPVPAASRSPRFTIRGRSLKRTRSRGYLRVRVVSLDPGPVRVTATSSMKKPGAAARRVTVAKRVLSFRTPGARKVKLHLTPAGRSLLGSRTRARVKLLAALTDCAGNARTRSLTVTLR